jgi:Arc/MetJ family transcription regulator
MKLAGPVEASEGVGVHRRRRARVSPWLKCVLWLDKDICEIYRDRMSKVLISLPDDLLQEIDRAVDLRGTTRSAFLQGAARAALGQPSQARIESALRRGQAALEAAGPFESVSLIRRDRDARDAADRRL